MIYYLESSSSERFGPASAMKAAAFLKRLLHKGEPYADICRPTLEILSKSPAPSRSQG